jgi:diaminopimelate epimerase
MKKSSKKKTVKKAPKKTMKKQVKKTSSLKTKVRKKRKFQFTKMVASGNDFIVFDNRKSQLNYGPEIAAQLCPRTSGIGADGLIFIEKSRKADFKMRIFNPDGSEAEMCGNGIRCAALYKGKKKMKIETLAGMLSAELKAEKIKVRMTDPVGLKLNVNLDINGKIYQVNYINTGVPHSIYFLENLEAARVKMLGRLLRYHKHFEPEGTNVDFVKIVEPDVIHIRTYERGVEDETLACGTGSVAAALVYHHKFIYSDGSYCVLVVTRSGEILKIYFDYEKGDFSNVWLEGSARIVYRGECYV